MGTIFWAAFAHFPVSYFGNSRNISNCFIILIFVVMSVIFDTATTTQTMASILSKKYFLIEVYTFLDILLLHT